MSGRQPSRDDQQDGQPGGQSRQGDQPQRGGPGGQGPGGPGADRSGERQDAGRESAVDQAAAVTDYDLGDWLSLEPGEEVVWVGEPTKMQLVGTAVTGVVLIPFLIGILILLLLPVSYVGLKHTDYVVTNRSLYVKKGIMSTNVESVDVDRIQNTEFTQSFWGKQFGFGTVEISTAGSSGADISFANVEDAREVRDEVARVQREFAGGGDRGARDGTGGGGRTRQTASDARVEELVSEMRATREALERVAAKLDEDDGARSHTASDDRGRGGGDRPDGSDRSEGTDVGEWADRADDEQADTGVDPANRRTSLDAESMDSDDQ